MIIIIIHSLSDKTINVNRTLTSLHEGSLKITLTVPLNDLAKMKIAVMLQGTKEFFLSPPPNISRGGEKNVYYEKTSNSGYFVEKYLGAFFPFGENLCGQNLKLYFRGKFLFWGQFFCWRKS